MYKVSKHRPVKSRALFQIEILDLFDNFAKEIFDLNTFTELFLKPIRLTGVIGPKYSQRKIKNLISKVKNENKKIEQFFNEKISEIQ